MSTTASISPFLNLPSSIRSKIYAYLFSPLSEEDVTTINYTLSWPYLDDPSNTTFAGTTQIDFCTCPRKDIHHKEDQHKPHFYTRYQCCSPDVHFAYPSQGLWLLQAAHGQFNILRPATATELERRPKVAVSRVSKQVHDESLPFLYRGRNFLFLTGPCPRGRYQAYATMLWLHLLSPHARKSVEELSLLVQPYEEDCSVADVGRSYMKLAVYIRKHLPGFKRLHLDVWDEKMYCAARAFLHLFDTQEVDVVVRKQWENT